MDFNDTPEEADYRAKARAWLEKNVAEHKAMNHADDMAAGKAWQRRKAEAGYAQITWPKEWGGAGFIDKMTVAESGGNAAADNPLSAAFGAHQFIESTWLDTMKKHGPRFGLGHIADQISVTASGSAYVTDGAMEVSLLGMDFLRHWRLEIDGDRMILTLR